MLYPLHDTAGAFVDNLTFCVIPNTFQKNELKPSNRNYLLVIPFRVFVFMGTKIGVTCSWLSDPIGNFVSNKTDINQFGHADSFFPWPFSAFVSSPTSPSQNYNAQVLICHSLLLLLWASLALRLLGSSSYSKRDLRHCLINHIGVSIWVYWICDPHVDSSFSSGNGHSKATGILRFLSLPPFTTWVENHTAEVHSQTL